jgi:ABC-type lipoprotein export system ATPase subunit
VVLVTHEPDIAKCATRVIEMRDGLVLSDHPVKDRLTARRAPDDAERKKAGRTI